MFTPRTCTASWRFTARLEDRKGYYLAIFNRGESALDIDLGWNEVGLGLGKAYRLRDLWERRDLGSATSLQLALSPHACVLHRISE